MAAQVGRKADSYAPSQWLRVQSECREASRAATDVQELEIVPTGPVLTGDEVTAAVVNLSARANSWTRHSCPAQAPLLVGVSLRPRCSVRVGAQLSAGARRFCAPKAAPPAYCCGQFACGSLIAKGTQRCRVHTPQSEWCASAPASASGSPDPPLSSSVLPQWPPCLHPSSKKPAQGPPQVQLAYLHGRKGRWQARPAEGRAHRTPHGRHRRSAQPNTEPETWARVAGPA